MLYNVQSLIRTYVPMYLDNEFLIKSKSKYVIQIICKQKIVQKCKIQKVDASVINVLCTQDSKTLLYMTFVELGGGVDEALI